jgi:hypothetical protein
MHLCATTRSIEADGTDLLHDTRLALRECDVATRFIGDELDLNLSSLTSGLIIIIVIIVGSRWALAFGTASVTAISETVIVKGRRRTLVGIGDVGHCFFYFLFLRYDENVSFEKSSDDLTAYGISRLLSQKYLVAIN